MAVKNNIIRAKHQVLNNILDWLPRCKDYPEWKQKIIAEHNYYHKQDEEINK